MHVGIHVRSTMLYSIGAWVLITLLPTLVLNNKKEDRPISTRDYVGWGLWALGFFFEALADYQKSAFKSNPDNAVSRYAENDTLLVVRFCCCLFFLFFFEKQNYKNAFFQVGRYPG